MKKLEADIKQYLEERAWDKLRPGDLAKSIAIEAGELLELFQWANPTHEEVLKDKKKLEEIKKELAEIHIASRDYSLAISLLQNHLQLNPTDWEAYNLLIECFYKMERFDTGLEIDYVSHFQYIVQKVKCPHFVKSNLRIMNDLNQSLINGVEPQNKLLYQDFRFNKYITRNILVIQDGNGRKKEFSEPIVTIGRNKDNDFPIETTPCSRRHCIIVNYSNDVWIYDMGSIVGVFVDGKKVIQKQFLLATAHR